MLKRTVCFVILGMAVAGTCFGEAPVVASLQQLWQRKEKWCGTLLVNSNSGIYEFVVGDGPTCVSSTGSDAVVFNSHNGALKEIYTIIPMARIVVTLSQ